MPARGETPRVEGAVAAGFERVGAAFEENFRQRGDVAAQCCVIVDGSPVVDLWGGYDRDAIQVVFSATKGATSACANLLVQRGLLDLDARVVDIWPEFGAHGKEKTLVRWVLTHKSGVLAPDPGLTMDDLEDWDRIVAALAAAAPAWEPGIDYGYHAHSYGWLVGELVRRVDGRGLGEFFRKEIAEPAGADLWIGLPESEEPRVAELIPPEADDFPDESNGDEPMEFGPHVIAASTLNGMLGDIWTSAGDKRYRRAELGGAGGVGSARGLARLYAWMLDEFTDETIADILRPETSGPDAVLSSPGQPVEQRFGRGFLVPPDLSPGVDVFGHGGAGGFAAFADPSRKVAFGYATTKMRVDPEGGSRAMALIDAVYDSLS